MAAEMIPAPLDDYLEATRDSGCDFATFDCCRFACDWIKQRTGVDPMGEFRGSYLGEIGARRLVRKHGGLMWLTCSRLWRAGLRPRIRAARAGDVGLLLMPTRRGAAPVGAISLGGGRWAITTEDGQRRLRARALMAWRLPHG